MVAALGELMKRSAYDDTRAHISTFFRKSFSPREGPNLRLATGPFIRRNKESHGAVCARKSRILKRCYRRMPKENDKIVFSPTMERSRPNDEKEEERLR
jgi:hypothetical protein